MPQRITPREAREAASRLRTGPLGERYVVRFNLRQRIEYLTLLISFTMLAVTGLPQRYADTSVGEFLLWLMGGIETARQIHHLFAVLFGAVSLFYVGVFVYEAFFYRRWGAMWPGWQDARDLAQMMAYNLGLAAVVADRGGPLSHAVIVAREYGIPAVLGVQDATARLQDGMRVVVDGGQGVVRVQSSV